MARYSQMKDGVCINVIEWDADKNPGIKWPDGVTVEPYELAHEELRPVPVSVPEVLPELYKQMVRDEVLQSPEFKQMLADEVAKVTAGPVP